MLALAIAAVIIAILYFIFRPFTDGEVRLFDRIENPPDSSQLSVLASKVEALRADMAEIQEYIYETTPHPEDIQAELTRHNDRINELQDATLAGMAALKAQKEKDKPVNPHEVRQQKADIAGIRTQARLNHEELSERCNQHGRSLIEIRTQLQRTAPLSRLDAQAIHLGDHADQLKKLKAEIDENWTVHSERENRLRDRVTGLEMLAKNKPAQPQGSLPEPTDDDMKNLTQGPGVRLGDGSVVMGWPEWADSVNRVVSADRALLLGHDAQIEEMRDEIMRVERDIPDDCDIADSTDVAHLQDQINDLESRLDNVSI